MKGNTQVYAFFALVFVAFLFWLQVTGKLRPILSWITTPIGQNPTGVANVSLSDRGPFDITQLAAYYQGRGGTVVRTPQSGSRTGVQVQGVTPLTPDEAQRKGEETYQQAKATATDVGLGLLAGTGPIGMAAAGIAKVLGFRL